MKKIMLYFKNSYALLFALLLALTSQAQVPPIEWQNTIGGSGPDALQSIVETSDGGFILGGYSTSGISGDKTEASQGGDDYWVVKLNSAGAIQWQNTIGGSSTDQLYSIAETSDGGFILGGYSTSGISGDKTEASQGGPDIWVVKLNSAGVIQWQNTIGGSGPDLLRSITETSDGGFILGGFSASGISGDKTEISQGGLDYWVLKLNSTGGIQWQNTIGGSLNDFLYSIAETSDGGFILGGYSTSGISGDKTEASQGGDDYWVVKLNSAGVIQWQNTIGGASTDRLNSIAETSDGGFILGGYSFSGISSDKTEAIQGGQDYWVVKLNSTGAIQWQSTIGGSFSEVLNSIAETSDGGFILDGYTPSGISGDKTEASQGGDDYWVVKLAAPIFTWTGVTSSSWNDASNWSGNAVPVATNIVIIPDVSAASGNFPVTSGNITVKDLTIDANASLTIGAGQGLIIAQNGLVTNNGTVTLEADATGTAWLDDFSNTGTTYTGPITAQQYVSTGSAVGQRMFGSPVNNGVVSGLNQTYASGSTGQIIMTNCASAQVTAASPYNNLFEWHEDAFSPNSCEYEAWFARLQSAPLENGRGYSGWMSSGSQISYTGIANTGNQSYGGGTLSNSNTGLPNKDGWHVLSNPYPSSLNVNALTLANWNSPQTYNASAAYGGTFQPILPGDDIAVAQGFVMKTSAPGNTANFTNAMRTQGSTTFKSNNDWFDAKLEIEVAKGTKKDISYIYFNSDASQAFDNSWDCEKKYSDAGNPTLFTQTTGVKTSLNGNNIAELGNYSFPLGLNPGSNGNFTFTVDGLNSFPASTLIYLEDKVTGTWTNLREQDTYAFNMTTQDAEDRFEVHFTKPIALTYEAESCEGNDGIVSVNFGNQSIGNQLQIWNHCCPIKKSRS